jgi:hypothetical protein
VREEGSFVQSISPRRHSQWLVKPKLPQHLQPAKVEGTGFEPSTVQQWNEPQRFPGQSIQAQS